MADAPLTEHTATFTHQPVNVAGTDVTVEATTHTLTAVFPSDTNQDYASTGHLLFPGPTAAKYRQPASGVGGGTDLPFPTTSYEVRFHASMPSLIDGRIWWGINNGATGDNRAFQAHSPEGGAATTLRYLVRSASTDSTDETVTDYWRTGEYQYRILHSGTTVTAYSRDPATYNLPLSSDANWTNEGSFTMPNVSAMNEPNDSGNWKILMRINGQSYGVNNIEVYEHRIYIDGDVESSAGFGEVTIDTVNNTFDDEQGQTWSWQNADDPTQTVGNRSGIIRNVSASSTATPATHTLTVTALSVTQLADPANYFVSVDWDDDGSYSDVTDDTLQVGSTSIGRDPIKARSTPIVADARFELLNTSGDYYPDNTGSPLNGLITPGHAIRIQSSTTGPVYVLFEGNIEDYDFDVTFREAVTVNARGPMAQLVGKRISTDFYQSITTGEAISHVLTAAGSTAPRDLDTGATTIRSWWVNDRTAWEAITELVSSEGPDAIVYIDPGTGAITFRDRYHRQTRTASTATQSTWRSTGAEPQFSDFRFRYGWDDIINSMSVTVDERTPTDRAVVWESDSVPFTVPAATIDFSVEATATEPFTGAAVVYETASGGALSTGLSRTSGQTTTIKLTTFPERVITRLALTGIPYPVTSTTTVTVEDSTSVAQHGRRDPGFTVPWLSSVNAADVLETWINHYKNPRQSITVGFVNEPGNTTRYLNQVGRSISDRVTVIESRSSTNRDYWVESIDHEITNAGLWHETQFRANDAVTGLIADADLFILDSATNGVLDTDKLGY